MVDEGALDSVGNLLQGGQLAFDLIANLGKNEKSLTKLRRRKLDRQFMLGWEKNDSYNFHNSDIVNYKLNKEENFTKQRAA